MEPRFFSVYVLCLHNLKLNHFLYIITHIIRKLFFKVRVMQLVFELAVAVITGTQSVN
jgi:hypothetical protein